MPDTQATKLEQLFLFLKQLQWLCKRSARFHYTKTGPLFYGPGWLYANLLDDHGLTTKGNSAVTTQLLDKLKSVGGASQFLTYACGFGGGICVPVYFVIFYMFVHIEISFNKFSGKTFS